MFRDLIVAVLASTGCFFKAIQDEGVGTGEVASVHGFYALHGCCDVQTPNGVDDFDCIERWMA
jgi:hypothetical protein